MKEVSKIAVSHGEALIRQAQFPIVLTDMLKRASESDKGIYYIQSNEKEHFQSYSQLRKEALDIYAGLKSMGLKAGDKIIFQIPDNHQFLTAFWGCVLGGYIPIPIGVAPDYKKPHQITQKISNTWNTFDFPLILTNAALKSDIQVFAEQFQLEKCRIATFEELQGANFISSSSLLSPNDIVLLLLTSGSTGTPKAVTQTHQSLIDRSIACLQTLKSLKEDITLNWLPLDHVVGLIMCHLFDMFVGCDQIHVDLNLILQNPLLWFDIIDQKRVTTTWAPNFVFGLVNNQLKSLPTRKNWDLSSLKYITNAGEPIVYQTTRTFLSLFGTYGLSPTCMYPAWGMSETCSAVTYAQFPMESAQESNSFVNLGPPLPGFSMRIVDNKDQVLHEEEIGELQVKGPSVTKGYLNNPKINAESYTSDGWFRTGDLGYLKDGQLTLTGRGKDSIIINGINFYSHEIEAAVESLEGIVKSYTASCAVHKDNNPNDLLAIFFVPKSTQQGFLLQLLKDIRIILVEQIGVNPTYLLPVKEIDIPKTAIGKIQRSQLVKQFSQGIFNEVIKLVVNTKKDKGSTQAQTENELSITRILKEVLAIEAINIHENFFEFGVDSVLLIQAHHQIESHFGIKLTIADVFNYSTVHELAKYIQIKKQQKASTYEDSLKPVATKIEKSQVEHQLSELDQLSSKEIDAILSEKLGA